MAIIKLTGIPHFVVKDNQFKEYEKFELFREYYSFFNYVFSVYNSLEFLIYKDKSNSAIDICFIFPDDYLIQKLNSNDFRYLRFQQCEKQYELNTKLKKINISKNLKIIPVGNLSYLHDNIIILPPYCNVNNEKSIFKIPFVQRINLTTSDYKWKNTLAYFTNNFGAIKIEINKSVPSTFDIQYATQCLSLYLYTYLNKLPSEELFQNISSYQSIISGDKIFNISIQLIGNVVENIQMAFLRDIDVNLLSANDNNKKYHELLNIDIEDESKQLIGNFIDNLTSTYNLDELVELISPPYTFSDALPNIFHFVPKPFIIPSFSQNVKTAENIILGTLENKENVTIALKNLNQHIFVTGTTGSGKTNSIFNILLQLEKYKIPFLVIDPVKQEYEELFNHLSKNKSNVNIFNFKERWITFNPFIPPPNINIYSHSTVLAKTLSILFPTTTVGYEYILKMIRETYIKSLIPNPNDKVQNLKLLLKITGKDLINKNIKPPTFNDFIETGSKWLQELPGQQSKFMQEAIEYFKRRWEFFDNSILKLVFSPKNDEYRTIYSEFEKPTLIELYSIIDSNEKNVLFSLFFALLYEFRLSNGLKNNLLEHVTVLEEAHRIVPREVSTSSKDMISSPEKESSILLSQMLAEIRALGEGLIIAEQSASKIIPDVLINTSTKIVHKITYGNDKDYLATTMSLSDREKDYLSFLNRDLGEAITFLPNAYQPLYINVPFINLKTQGGLL